ncbi:DUF6344 domain-containing protein [Streptomyces dioscori]|uniref:DUF6344 domain-containing protein n=1 Tax=Streptomyces dioscori TaxID=2109333 RepID=UPI0026C55290|nr:DUF6344 domain-containing protein [Streptomyces dioscori]
MTRNKVMNLWTAVVTAFLALCTSLGLITTTAVAAVPTTEAARNLDAPREATEQEEPIWTRPRASALPPTMKQRIHAEAHGSSPSCRHRPPTDAMDADASVTRDSAEAPAIVAAAMSAAVPTAVDTTDSAARERAAREPVTRDAAATPAHPCGTTHMTTGTADAPEVQAARTATPATPAGQTGQTGQTRTAAPAAPAAPAVDTASLGAVMLPSQSSAPVQLPALAPAPVLATAGSATRG